MLLTTGAASKALLKLQMVWCSLRLGVNGHLLEADRPDWLNGENADPVRAKERCFAKTVGGQLIIGEWPGTAGFRGTVDEVRLRRGIHRFYPWDLGRQELPEDHEVVDPQPNIWLGGDEAGLYFGGENDQGWTVGYTLSLASTAYEYAGSKSGRRPGFTALA